MKSVIQSAVLASVLFAASVFRVPATLGQSAKPGEQAPEFGNYDENQKEDRIYLSRYRGKIVVLEFWRTDDHACLESISILNDLHRKYHKKGVVVLGLSSEGKDAVQKVAEEKKIEFTYGYGGAIHEIYEVTSFPQVFLIDPRGTIAWRGRPSDELDERVSDLMARTPPVGANAAAIRKRLEAAERAHQAGDLGRAAGMAREVAAADDEALQKKGHELLSKIEESGRKKLGNARGIVNEDKLDEACARLAELIVAFEGSDLGREASEESEKFKSELPKSKDVFPKAISQARGALRNQQARDMEDEKDFEAALAAYQEVVDKYGGTESAKAAQEAIDRVNTDPAAQASMKDKRAHAQAQRWLEIGDRYARVDMNDQAREQYERVIKTHPGSPSAERARKRLEKMKKGP